MTNSSRWWEVLAIGSMMVIALSLLWMVSDFSEGRPHRPTPTFAGFACNTANCTVHREGYISAAQLQVSNIADCDTGTASFQEGCKAWVKVGPGLLNGGEGATPSNSGSVGPTAITPQG